MEVNYGTSASDEQNLGFYYLLVDNQDDLQSEQFYRRTIYEITNNQGVAEMSDLTVDYDPEYQKLFFHHIRIIREGQIIDRFEPGKIRTVQRESNLERKLYDGRLTAIINLDDVREGDVVDYAYTVQGYNPIHQGKYDTTFTFQYPLPIDRYHVSVRVPSNETVNYKLFNDAREPKKVKHENHVLYVWDYKDLDPIVYENNVPVWYDPAPYVDISQYSSWKSIIEQYQSHYSISAKEKNRLKKEAAAIWADSKTDPIQAAIQFVQDEVRYLGFENGINAQKPSQPSLVLERRFGDCKDKSFLLSELLQSQGLDAYPMLVHSAIGKTLYDRLPSPNIFNHCVVQIDMGTYFKYIDPTINLQGGKPEEIYFPNYHYGLVLKEGETSLSTLPLVEPSGTEITETFTLDKIGGGALMEVTTKYMGSDADSKRQEFSSNDKNQIQQSYLNFYSVLYPRIRVDRPMNYEDSRAFNEFTVSEFYAIDSIWSDSPEREDLIFLEFYPISIQDYLYPTSSPSREMPYAINPNIKVDHKTIVYLPEEWNIQNDHVRINDKSFYYAHNVKYFGNRLEILHSYGSLKSFLDPSEVVNYLEKHKSIQQNLSYYLSYDRALAGMDNAGTAWWAIFLLVALMIGMAFFCYRLYYRYDPVSKTNEKFTRKIGGWLILVAIGLTLTPLILLFELVFTSEYFEPSTWSAVFHPANNKVGMGIVMLFELIYNTLFFVYSILIVILFYQRRTSAPKLIVIFYAVSTIFVILDTVILLSLYPDLYTGAERQDSYIDMIKMIIRSAIWIPYFLLSSRVAETFTKRVWAEESKEDKSLAISEHSQ
ncbi:DUF3857 domain-containing protein [Croceiramulus getboli]|nr:DUF3857 domain-containing protein [Flavobacteriaceae bacterium YJPT1-3]